MQKWQCCICKEKVTGRGHNPEPIEEYKAGSCCGICNSTRVVPTRMSLSGMGFQDIRNHDLYTILVWTMQNKSEEEFHKTVNECRNIERARIAKLEGGGEEIANN